MNAQEPGTSVDILLVEDNPGDVLLIRECMKDLQHLSTLRVAVDGVEAMEILKQAGPHAAAPLPDLVILDLNLPRKSGLEVLQEMKSDAGLRRIPVVILTSSKSQGDIMKCYNLQASCYVVKPLGLDEFTAVVRSFESFWLTSVCYPAREMGGTCTL